MEGGREGRGAERFLLLAAMGETVKERGRRRTEVTLKWLTRDPIYGRLLVLLEGRRLPRKLRQSLHVASIKALFPSVLCRDTHILIFLILRRNGRCHFPRQTQNEITGVTLACNTA